MACLMVLAIRDKKLQFKPKRTLKTFSIVKRPAFNPTVDGVQPKSVTSRLYNEKVKERRN